MAAIGIYLIRYHQYFYVGKTVKSFNQRWQEHR